MIDVSDLRKLAEGRDARVLSALSIHPYVNIRGRVARNVSTPAGILEMLLADQEDVSELAAASLERLGARK